MINHQISLNPYPCAKATSAQCAAGSYGHLTGIVSAAGKLLCRCAILDGEVAPSAEARSVFRVALYRFVVSASRGQVV